MMAIAPDGTNWTRHGEVGRPTVVLIHGLGLNQAVWDWMVPALAPHFDVITYDLYGHGQTAPPPSTPLLSLFATQLARLLDLAGVERAAIVGFSLGGMICRRFAQDNPERSRGLVILNSPYRRTAEAQAAILKRVDQAAQDGPAATVEDALVRWFTDAYRTENPEVMDLVRRWVLANDPAIYPSVYRVLAEGIDEICQPDPSLRLPALVMTGDEDFGNGPEMTKAIAAEIEGAEAVILPRLRHMALVEDPDAVNLPVKAFLDRILMQ